MERWPGHLIVHLHRLLVVKDNRFVGFDFVWVPSEGVTYHLQTVVVHIGASGAGHYVCYGRQATGQWEFYTDEALPVLVTQKAVGRQLAFILIYVKQ